MKLFVFRTILTKESNRYSSYYEKIIPIDSIDKWFIGTVKDARLYSMKHNILLQKVKIAPEIQKFQYNWRGTNLTNNLD